MTRALNSRSHRRGCGRKVVPNRSRFCKLFLLACLVSVAVIRPSPVFAGSFSFTPLQWSPDGQRLVTIIRIGKVPQSLSERLSPKHKQARYEIWLLRSDGSRLRKVSQQPDFPQWVGNEHLLLGRETLPTEGDLKWDLVDLRGERVARIVSEAPELLAWEVSPDGRYLAYVGDWPQKEPFQCAVFLYQFSDRRTVGRYSIDNYAWNISWSPDSRYLYVAGEWRLDMVDGRLEHKDKERISIGGFNDFAVNDTGQMVAAAGPGLVCVDWQTGKYEEIAEGNFDAIAFGRDPKVFICGKWKEIPKTAEIWLGRLRDGIWQLSKPEGVRASSMTIAISQDSKRFAYEAPDGKIKVGSIPRASR